MKDETTDVVDIAEIDFSEIYEESLASDYAREVANDVGEQYERVIGTEATYVKSDGWILRSHELAVQAEGPRLRYNNELFTKREIYEAIEGLGSDRISKSDVNKLLEQRE